MQHDRVMDTIDIRIAMFYAREGGEVHAEVALVLQSDKYRMEVKEHIPLGRLVEDRSMSQ